MKTIHFNENTIVAFHIGRGGRFNNPGHITFTGQHDISFYADNLFPSIEDNPNAELRNECGNGVGLTNAELESGIGRIERDGEYDTTYTMYLKDVEEDSKEWDAIFADYTFDAEQAQLFLRPELAIDNLNELAGYINHNDGWELAVTDIIERNNWKDLTSNDYDVCEDTWQRITLNDNGEAVVIDID